MKYNPKVDQLLSYSQAANIKHGHRTLEDHLRGCVHIAEILNVSETVLLACAGHSLYGTSSFRGALVEREPVIDIIGVEANHLIELFCSLNRVSKWWSQPRPVIYSEQEWSDLILVEVINLTEQS